MYTIQDNLNDSWKDITQWHPNVGDKIIGLYRDGSIEELHFTWAESIRNHWTSWIFNDNEFQYTKGERQYRKAPSPKLWKYSVGYTTTCSPQKVPIK
jgi:hypothetical protein